MGKKTLVALLIGLALVSVNLADAFEGPHDPRLRHFLGEISGAEARVGRGMLTALVVHKHGDYQPVLEFIFCDRKESNQYAAENIF